MKSHITSSMKSQLDITSHHITIGDTVYAPVRRVEHELRHGLVSLLADHVQDGVLPMLVVVGLVDVLEVHHHLVTQLMVVALRDRIGDDTKLCSGNAMVVAIVRHSSWACMHV